jgi:hypothetical protein
MVENIPEDAMYFRRVPARYLTYYGLSAASNFIAAAVLEPRGWMVYRGAEHEQAAVREEPFETMEDAFDFITTIQT